MPRVSTRGLAGYVLVALAAASWGAQSVVAKVLLTRSALPAAPLVSLRMALATLLLLASLATLRPRAIRVAPGHLLRLALLGTAGMAASNYFYYLTLERVPVAMAALLIYSAPIFVLAAEALGGRRPRALELVAAAVALVGAALVVRVHELQALRVNAAGLASGVASALAFAFYTVWGRALPRDLSPWTVLLWSFVAGALLWLPLAPPWALLATPLPGPVWAGIGVVTVFGTLVPFGLYLAGLRRIGPAHASVTSTLEPVLSGAAAFLVLGESLGPVQLAGGALVLGGLVLLHARR